MAVEEARMDCWAKERVVWEASVELINLVFSFWKSGPEDYTPEPVSNTGVGGPETTTKKAILKHTDKPGDGTAGSGRLRGRAEGLR
jgi:hypothetical protein